MNLAQRLSHFSGGRAVMPKVAPSVVLKGFDDPEIMPEPNDLDDVPQAISAFMCIIEYEGMMREITGRRYDIIGENAYVGAICHTAGGYRQFRADRISSVIDRETGEVIGDGRYFSRFEVKSERDAAPQFGLSPGRRATLVAGLNVLAFMARCDGRWHPLESEPVEQFATTMWIRKEWEGDMPMDEVMSHARRLAPDATSVLRGLHYYARSRTSTNILMRAVSDLIAADGVICASEVKWAVEIDQHIKELQRYGAVGTGFAA